MSKPTNRELTRNLYKWEIDTWKKGHHYYSSEKDRDHSEIPLHTKMAKIKKKLLPSISGILQHCCQSIKTDKKLKFN